MSAIPPNPIVSVLGSGEAQRTKSRVDDAARNDRADGARALAGEGDVILEVESTDGEKEVHADAEGSGGSGRQGRWEEGDTGDADEREAAEPGAGHLDVSA